MNVEQAPFGESEVIDEVFSGVLVETRQSRGEVSGIVVHQLGDLPGGWRLVSANADVAETPVPRDIRCQVCADGAVEVEQEVMNGQILEPPVGDGQLGFGDALGQQRRKLPIAQDAGGRFDIAGR